MNKAELKQKTYRFNNEESNMCRHADIVFLHYDTGWVFHECKYVCGPAPYNLRDWEFLHDLSAEILRLQEEVNNG